MSSIIPRLGSTNFARARGKHKDAVSQATQWVHGPCILKASWICIHGCPKSKHPQKWSKMSLQIFGWCPPGFVRCWCDCFYLPQFDNLLHFWRVMAPLMMARSPRYTGCINQYWNLILSICSRFFTVSQLVTALWAARALTDHDLTSASACLGSSRLLTPTNTNWLAIYIYT